MEIDFSFETFKHLSDSLLQRLRHLQFGNKAQLAFLEDLYVLVNDGIPANRAIEMMAQITSGRNREVALSIAQKISEGRPLAEGMRNWFSLNVIEIIRVGEEGGALKETIKSAIKSMSERSGSLTAFISAVSYPLMVITMACIVIVYLNQTVFVQFKTLKPISEWPQAGRDLLTIADIIQNWWWLVILVVIGFVILLQNLMKNYIGEFRGFLDTFPPFSLYRRFVAARFMETLGLLVANGVVFKNAIKVMLYQATPYLSSHLVSMEHLLSMGKGNVADVLSTGLIDAGDVMRLRVMAEVKGFEHGLIRMGVRGSDQSTKTIKLISRIFGGILLAVGAYLIVVIVKGIYLTGMAMGSM
jgi:type II secretory pathway component PulF